MKLELLHEAKLAGVPRPLPNSIAQKLVILEIPDDDMVEYISDAEGHDGNSGFALFVDNYIITTKEWASEYSGYIQQAIEMAEG